MTFLFLIIVAQYTLYNVPPTTQNRHVYVYMWVMWQPTACIGSNSFGHHILHPDLRYMHSSSSFLVMFLSASGDITRRGFRYYTKF